MYLRSHPRYEIECAIINVKTTTHPKNRIIGVKKNWDKMIDIKQPEVKETEDTRIKKLEYKIFRIETKLKDQRKNIESIINMR